MEQPAKRARIAETASSQDIRHSATHPKFLHSNSTSHQWVFGAIAELIDNAVDPDVAAKRIYIDVYPLRAGPTIGNEEQEGGGELSLMIIDDGNGMDHEGLHKLLSFGYNTKAETYGRTIGKYGNGFKSGSMRLGQDALVFTKPRGGTTKSCGFLSQTFLKDIAAEEVLIPMVSWGKDGNADTGAVSEGATANIDLIKRYSPFKTEEALLNVFAKIDGSGTAIVIYNLRREEDGNLELDFESNSEDIMLRGLRGQATGALRPYQRPRNNQSDIDEVPIDQSLREYCRVLYKEPRMQIVLRGKIVRTLRILTTTTRRKKVRYKPHASSQAGQQGAALSDNGYTITFGFQPERNKHLYGIMLYHHNRLIYPYLRVGVQTQANEAGVGVLGVMEADFLDPTHNKQDFHDNQTWRRMLASLSEKLNMYWYEETTKMAEEDAQQKEAPSRRRGGGRSNRHRPTPRLRRQLADLYRAVLDAADPSGKPLADEFQKLPPREMYPDYYILINRPIALANMKAKIDSDQYRCLGELEKDIRLMCSNARDYNEEESEIYNNVTLIEQLVEAHLRQSVGGTGVSRGTAIALDDDTAEAGDGAFADTLGLETVAGEEVFDHWVQCDNPACLKWRKLPFGTSLPDTDAEWFCHLNADLSHNSCDIPEDKEEEEVTAQNPKYKSEKSMMRAKAAAEGTASGVDSDGATTQPAAGEGVHRILVKPEPGAGHQTVLMPQSSGQQHDQPAASHQHNVGWSNPSQLLRSDGGQLMEAAHRGGFAPRQIAAGEGEMQSMMSLSRGAPALLLPQLPAAGGRLPVHQPLPLGAYTNRQMGPMGQLLVCSAPTATQGPTSAAAAATGGTAAADTAYASDVETVCATLEELAKTLKSQRMLVQVSDFLMGLVGAG